jgi:hypothetical protein
MKKRVDKRTLPIVLRMAGRSVVLVGEGPVADTHRQILKRAGAQVVGEGSKAALAIVIDDPAAVSRMKMRGALVYAVGQPDLSDFTLTEAFEAEPEPETLPDPSRHLSLSQHLSLSRSPPGNLGRSPSPSRRRNPSGRHSPSLCRHPHWCRSVSQCSNQSRRLGLSWCRSRMSLRHSARPHRRLSPHPAPNLSRS